MKPGTVLRFKPTVCDADLAGIGVPGHYLKSRVKYHRDYSATRIFVSFLDSEDPDNDCWWINRDMVRPACVKQGDK